MLKIMYPRQAICIGDKAKIYTPLKEHGEKSYNNLLPFVALVSEKPATSTLVQQVPLKRLKRLTRLQSFTS